MRDKFFVCPSRHRWASCKKPSDRAVGDVLIRTLCSSSYNGQWIVLNLPVNELPLQFSQSWLMVYDSRCNYLRLVIKLYESNNCYSPLYEIILIEGYRERYLYRIRIQYVDDSLVTSV